MSRTIPVARVLGFFFICFFVSAPVWAKDEVRYTKFNIHTQTKDGKTHKASYANYTNPGAGHVIIPAGSEILITKKRSKAFYFRFDNGKNKAIFEFHQPRMGMSVAEYIGKISSAEPVSLDGLSELDRKGVSQGQALIGMSKKGVMTALGYPAAHRTPSLESSTWIYWTNRFGTLAVEFGANGKVSSVLD